MKSELLQGSSLRDRFGDARRTSSGSAMRSQHSSVCLGIAGDWRWRLRWQTADDDTSQRPSSGSRRDAKLFSVLGNRFATHSDVSRKVRVADQPDRNRRDFPQCQPSWRSINSPPAVQPQQRSSRRLSLGRDSPSRPLQARQEAWRTVQRHRLRRGLTRHLPPCPRSRDGKTAYERSVGRRAVLPSPSPLTQFCERVWWMPLQPSNRRLGPLRYLGPMDGSNAVLVDIAS